MMRIITGRARGTKLYTLEGEMTRPTAERTKEAVFSMLQFQIRDANVLDLFAGSGQLGLEAASRGAAHVVLCDRARDAVEIVRRNVQKTGLGDLCEVFCSDYAQLLHTMRGRAFDIVFLDPPYALGAVPVALKSLVDLHLLASDALIVCETAEAGDVFGNDEQLKSAFEIQKQARYGAAHVTVLRAIEKGVAEV